MDDEHMSDAEQEQEDENIERKIANEEYKIWKKNAVWLYDMLYARALEWPTLTAQWFPDKKEVPDSNLTKHRILFGTNTSGNAPNYLQIASIDLPTAQGPEPADYDAQRGEIGGFGAGKKGAFSFDVVQRINHPGEVNKARYQPQNPNIIATMCTDGRALIFDRTKHRIQPGASDEIKFEMELTGHEEEGFGLDWSPHIEGQLVTGSQDSTVRLWDIKAGFSKSRSGMSPLRTFTHHTACVNDVQHHPLHESWIGTVADDRTLQILDTRQDTNTLALFTNDAHDDAVNCIAFCPKWESIVATGSADKTVALWDLRCLNKKLHSLEGHTQDVINLEWHPSDVSIIASSSYDKRILIWDLSKIGDEQTDENAEDGPPELLFMHGGFTNGVCDFSWNKNNPWVMVAAAEDNQLQVFRPARTIVEMPVHKATNGDISE